MKRMVRSIIIVMALLTVIMHNKADALGSAQSRQGFIPNKGQWHSDILWFAHTDNVNVWITKKGINFDYRQIVASKQSNESALHSSIKEMSWSVFGQNVRMNLAGATGQGMSVIASETGTKMNYFMGNDASKWVSNVPVCSQAVVSDIQPGIDMVVAVDKGLPRYDFVVKPGANHRDIALSFEGANSVNIESGSVEYTTRFGTVKNAQLLAYQLNADGSKSPVSCEFKQKGTQVIFNLGDYDKSRSVIIDPTVYATYLGTNKLDEIRKIARDNITGDIVAVGFTDSDQFPTTVGSYSNLNNGFGGSTDAFVTKFSADLTSVKWSTFIGGGGVDKAVAVALDPNANIYIAGETTSTDFPNKGNFILERPGAVDAFFAKLSSIGDKLLASSYIGGRDDDRATDIAVDNAGLAVVVGETFSENFKVEQPDKSTKPEANNSDGFIVKFNTSGANATYSSYFGGNENDRINGVAVDPSGNSIYITGETEGTLYKTYPVPPGGPGPQPTPYDAAPNGGKDCFVARMSPAGLFNNPNVHFITYIGGTTSSRIGDGEDVGKVIVPLSNGEIVVVGQTTGNLFATGVAGQHRGAVDLFILKLNQNGRSLVSAAYLGGSGTETVNALSYSSGTSSVWITGTTTSTNFPNNPGSDPEQTKLTGGADAFVYQFDPGNLQSTFSRFMGGTQPEEGTGVAVTPRGDIYFAGTTRSTGLLSFGDSYQKTFGGGTDGFVRKHAFGSISLEYPNGGAADVFCPGNTINVRYTKNAPLQPGDVIAVQLSTNSGVTWDTIGKNVTTPDFVWQIPATQKAGTNYRIRVIHESGIRDESNADFTIIAAPTVTESPKSDTICPGDSTTFMVQATGTNLTYQWLFGTNKLQGETRPTLTLRDVKSNQAGKYSVEIGSGCSPIVYNAQLTVKVATAITTQPTGVKVKENDPYTLSVKAVGENLTYQWFRKNTVIDGAVTASYNIPSVNAFSDGEYTVTVSGNCGSVTSQPAIISFEAASVFDDGVSPNGVLSIGMLSPMPVFEQMNIAVTSQTYCPLTVTLTDMMGGIVRTVYSGTLESLNVLPLSIGCADLPSGTYYLNARCGVDNAVLKVTIVK